jgi:hypothetical protein
MSYGPFISSKIETNNLNTNNNYKKEKFIDTKNKNFIYETPGFWKYETKQNITDQESDLIKSININKKKSNIQLTQKLNPNNYNISVTNTNNNNKEKEKLYYSTCDSGPGRGFGNLNISNNIRFGDNTRLETKNFKIKKESELVDRWDLIDNRFQNVNNIVLPLPRGGDTTRKIVTDLNYNTIDENIEFNFKY